MSDHKWYQKATIQAAIVNAIPNIIVAFVAILAMVSMYNISNRQIEQNEKLARERYKKDSLLVELQLRLAEKELELNKEQFFYNREKSKLDSIHADKSLTISNKQLKIAEINEKLDELTEKSNLQKLNAKILDKLLEFFKEKNPKPQEPIKLGEKRERKYVSELMLNYNLQNKWAQELKELLYLGLSNRYLLSKEKAFNLWKKCLGTTDWIIGRTNNFLKEDFTFKDSYDFKKLFNIIWESRIEAYIILFKNPI